VERWDYLIVTASNGTQAQEYEMQLRLRRQLGFLECVREVLVVPDPGGKRVGSGGSTIYCLLEILRRELAKKTTDDIVEPQLWCDIFRQLRILIVHAGGDSKRLPAYGPYGKIFVPVPGEGDCCLPLTLFDRQVPTYLKLPAPPSGIGQIVISSCDILLFFESHKVQFAEKGLIGLGCYASPEQAKNHGVFCRGDADQVRFFLQKPSLVEQQKMGVIDPQGRAILDVGIMSFDAATAVMLLEIFGAQCRSNAELQLTGELGEALLKYGLDFYREICCGMGTEANLTRYVSSSRQSGSLWDNVLLGRLFKSLSKIPFYVKLLPQCEFLHFGASRQLISSGNTLMQKNLAATPLCTCLSINNEITDQGQVIGTNAWIEGCRLNSTLKLGGENVIAGVDVHKPLSLPSRMCLDVIPGQGRTGKDVCFVRFYSVHDTFNSSIEQGATFCGLPVLKWLELMGAQPEDVWDVNIPPQQRSLWNARIFPAIREHQRYYDWLWLFNLAEAGLENYRLWQSADRYSPAEVTRLADQAAFHRRRSLIRAREMQKSQRKLFAQNSEFSACELAHILKNEQAQSVWFASLLNEARWWHNNSNGKSLDSMVFPRVIHTLGSALSELGGGDVPVEKVLPELPEKLTGAEQDWLGSLGLGLDSSTMLSRWTQRAWSLAFESLGQAIVSTGADRITPPHTALRVHEIVWGCAPARLDTGGTWTDTPPYCLEHGGCMVDTAVNMNGQVPIQVYLRVTEEPVIRINSIDSGTRIEITAVDELVDCRKPTSDHALAQAALVLSGFTPETAKWPHGSTLGQMLRHFGGGIELTTLVSIPKGSGLGTSSILAAVILAVIQKAIGRKLTLKELFHAVLRIEQLVTTGGGWQDQIGGIVGGTKIVTTKPGLVPAARIHHLPSDVLNPKVNNGQTLLYYTGITRLAKGILSQIVGRYLDRDRKTLSTLRQIHNFPPLVAGALSRKDIRAFGQLIDAAWQLKKQLCSDSTNDEVEALLSRIQPYILGATLLGAGGGGFLLIVCKSTEDAKKIRVMLENQPDNQRARFFDYSINTEGLVVRVC